MIRSIKCLFGFHKEPKGTFRAIYSTKPKKARPVSPLCESCGKQLNNLWITELNDRLFKDIHITKEDMGFLKRVKRKGDK